LDFNSSSDPDLSLDSLVLPLFLASISLDISVSEK
jgi:hypothetical protein